MIGNALHTLNAPHERFEFLTNLFDVLYQNNDMKLPNLKSYEVHQYMTLK